MATSVLTSEGVLSTCSACHTAGGAAPPDKARESAPILALVRAETMLYSAVAADPRATRGSRAAPMLASARRNLSAAAEVWHTFRLDSASARLAAARQDISGAWTALGHRPPLEARLPETPRSERP
jgi:hypothetical protein